MKTLDIYLDFSFLRLFLENEPQDHYSDDYQNWLDFLKFLQKHNFVKIITPNNNTEIPKNNFVLQLHQLLRNKSFRQDFFNDLPSNTENYKVSIAFEYNIQIKNPHSIFFIEFSKEQCQELENKYGYFFINWENFKTKWKLLNPRNYQSFKIVSKTGNLGNWSSFSKLKHPANAIIIIDRYFFKGFSKENIENMFGNLFEKIEYKFDVTLILGKQTIKDMALGYINTNNSEILHIREETKNIKKNIKSVIKNKLSKQDNLTIIQIFKGDKSDLDITHDRRIISNYFYMVSGASLSYENKEGKILVDTDFHIYTIFDSETFGEITKRFDELKPHIIAQDQTGHVEGNKQNRLLE